MTSTTQNGAFAASDGLWPLTRCNPKFLGKIGKGGVRISFRFISDIFRFSRPCLTKRFEGTRICGCGTWAAWTQLPGNFEKRGNRNTASIYVKMEEESKRKRFKNIQNLYESLSNLFKIHGRWVKLHKLISFP